MTKLSATLLLGWLALGLGGCGSDEDALDDLGEIATVSISALPYAPDNGFEVTEAGVSLGRIDLVPCGDEGTIGINDFPVDLLRHPPVQALYETGLLEYCRVHLAVEPALLVTGGEPLGARV